MSLCVDEAVVLTSHKETCSQVYRLLAPYWLDLSWDFDATGRQKYI